MLTIPDSLKDKHPVGSDVYWAGETVSYFPGLFRVTDNWYFARIYTLGKFPCQIDLFGMEKKQYQEQRSYYDIPSLEEAMALIHALYLFGDVT